MPEPIPEPKSEKRKKAGNPVVAVVVPCYRETGHVLSVIEGIGKEVSHIIAVDDACPDNTGEHVRANCTDKRVEVVVHEKNQGVGGATITGYRKALELGAGIIVKLDGDGQMDPSLIPSLIAPIVEGKADYTKGNRFHHLGTVSQMPPIRVFGNLFLSFACKLSSGYWNIFDTTNGFTAIHSKVIPQLPLERVSNSYFFETDMLLWLNLAGAVVRDIPMRARYEDEKSSLKIRSVLFEFSAKHFRNTLKRLFYAYFLKDFNAASVELVLGNILLVFGIIYGAIGWRQSIVTGVTATAGEVLLAALPVILGSQLLIAFINFDTRNIPKDPLHPRL